MDIDEVKEVADEVDEVADESIRIRDSLKNLLVDNTILKFHRNPALRMEFEKLFEDIYAEIEVLIKQQSKMTSDEINELMNGP